MKPSFFLLALMTVYSVQSSEALLRGGGSINIGGIKIDVDDIVSDLTGADLNKIIDDVSKYTKDATQVISDDILNTLKKELGNVSFADVTDLIKTVNIPGLDAAKDTLDKLSKNENLACLSNLLTSGENAIEDGLKNFDIQKIAGDAAKIAAEIAGSEKSLPDFVGELKKVESLANEKINEVKNGNFSKLKIEVHDLKPQDICDQVGKCELECLKILDSSKECARSLETAVSDAGKEMPVTSMSDAQKIWQNGVDTVKDKATGLDFSQKTVCSMLEANVDQAKSFVDYAKKVQDKFQKIGCSGKCKDAVTSSYADFATCMVSNFNSTIRSSIMTRARGLYDKMNKAIISMRCLVKNGTGYKTFEGKMNRTIDFKIPKNVNKSLSKIKEDMKKEAEKLFGSEEKN